MTQDTPGDRLPGIDAAIRTIMRDWKVPGLTFAVYADGKMLTARGYGFADVERKQPANPDTAFAIGSCTKAFTTTALAMLVEGGRLDWDRPIRDYLPGFKLMDEVAGARVTARDLACHRTGVPRHDAVWYKAALARHELVARLAHLAPSKDLRVAYQYNNLMYIAAGVLVEALSGMRWEEFVRRRILDPLGMNRASFSPARALALGNMALPYQARDGRVERIPFMAEGEDALSSAGWLHASAVEMARWLGLHLAGGTLPGVEPLIARARLAETHTPQVVAPEPQPMFSAFGEIGFPTYGLGWRVQTYRGINAVSHGGAIDGYCAHASFLPTQGLAAVVLTNLDDHPAAQIALYRLYDALLGLEPIDWNDRIKKRTAEAKAEAAAAAALMRGSRAAGAVGQPASAFAGVYRNPGYGAITVEASGDAITLTHNHIDYAGARLGANAFELSHALISEPRFARFFLDAAGRVSAVAIQFEPAVDEIVFARL